MKQLQCQFRNVWHELSRDSVVGENHERAASNAIHWSLHSSQVAVRDCIYATICIFTEREVVETAV